MGTDHADHTDHLSEVCTVRNHISLPDFDVLPGHEPLVLEKNTRLCWLPGNVGPGKELSKSSGKGLL